MIAPDLCSDSLAPGPVESKATISQRSRVLVEPETAMPGHLNPGMHYDQARH
jgi:hypothetical protein